MGGSWLERLRRWWCRRYGHRGRIDYNSPGGGGPEICRTCGQLLSTAWSRAQPPPPLHPNCRCTTTRLED